MGSPFSLWALLYETMSSPVSEEERAHARKILRDYDVQRQATAEALNGLDWYRQQWHEVSIGIRKPSDIIPFLGRTRTK